MTFPYTISFLSVQQRYTTQNYQILLYILKMTRLCSYFYIYIQLILDSDTAYRINLRIQIRIKLEQTPNIEILLYRNI